MTVQDQIGILPTASVQAQLLAVLSYYYYIIITHLSCLHVDKVRLQRSCSPKAATNPTPCWTRHVQAWPNQPWARCSLFLPPPASRDLAVAGYIGCCRQCFRSCRQKICIAKFKTAMRLALSTVSARCDVITPLPGPGMQLTCTTCATRLQFIVD
jgi:hypothetical protein